MNVCAVGYGVYKNELKDRRRPVCILYNNGRNTGYISRVDEMAKARARARARAKVLNK